MVFDFRRSSIKKQHLPLYVYGKIVEVVENLGYLGVTLSVQLALTPLSVRMTKKAGRISKDSTHPGLFLFELKWLRTIRTRTNRIRNSFYHREVASNTPTPTTLQVTVDTAQKYSQAHTVWHILLG